MVICVCDKKRLVYYNLCDMLQSESSSHLKMLASYKSDQTALDRERQECRQIKQRLVNLQAIEKLMNGNQYFGILLPDTLYSKIHL